MAGPRQSAARVGGAGQTVNLLATPSQVRILPGPPSYAQRRMPSVALAKEGRATPIVLSIVLWLRFGWQAINLQKTGTMIAIILRHCILVV